MFVKGAKRFERYLKKVRRRTPYCMLKAVKNTAEYIDKVAMLNLSERLGSGYTRTKWGHSNETSIADSKVITTSITPDKAEAKLEYCSPHSWIVEFGGIGRVTSKDTAFPIGKSQGLEPIFRESFRLQPGYHFLTDAVLNPNTILYFDKQTNNAICKSLRKWF